MKYFIPTVLLRVLIPRWIPFVNERKLELPELLRARNMILPKTSLWKRRRNRGKGPIRGLLLFPGKERRVKA